ncbi:piggyBac transposable element-derived protein 3-like [Leptopilina heterotoma]|uniref:piggyBac transposable element-derived protein 3-like n=1 Tax=Leptopilina heterotoma TaxID=63436 RepID=UPI001CA7ED6D|nr:piggyBac transposable element-derived protein 3-like [Leptopilina heterotoma]
MKEHIIDASGQNGLQIPLHEFDVFIAIIILSSFNTRNSERDYWSNDPLLECAIVKSAMSRNRFLEIKTGIKYSEKEEESSTDFAWRVRTLLKMFNFNVKRFGFFQTAISGDEMMVKFYGRLRFKQYIRTKPVRFGIKLWALCGSDGFLFECDIYCGKNAKTDGALIKCALGSRVILKLTEQLLMTTSRKKIEAYHLYFDNYFSSPDLLIHLKKVGLNATGVVQKNRVKEKNSLEKNPKRGSFKVKHEKNSGLNYITLMDSKEVSLLSTCAGISPLQDRKRYSKEKKCRDVIAMLSAFSNYNSYMGGVDLHDQYCSYLLPSFRSKKWPWPVLMRLIQSSITNAVILHNAVQKDGKKHQQKISQ